MSPNLLYFSRRLTPYKQFVADRLRAKDRPQWSWSVRGEYDYRRKLRAEWKKLEIKRKAKNKAEKLHQRILASKKKRIELERIRREKARKKNEEFLKKQRAAAELKANEARVSAARKAFQKRIRLAELEGKKAEKLKERDRLELKNEQIKEQRKQVDRQTKKAEKEAEAIEKLRIKALETEVRKELFAKQKQEKIDKEYEIKKRREDVEAKELLEKEVEKRVSAKEKEQLKAAKEAQKVAREEGRPFAIIEQKLFQAPAIIPGYQPPPELVNLSDMIAKSSKKAGDKLLRESAFMGWLTTPWQNLAKLPDAVVTDFKEIVLGQRKEPLSFSFPKWEDVVRLGPEPTLTDQEWKDYKAWNNQRKKASELLKQGDFKQYEIAVAGIGANPLSKESQEILRKRNARRKQMKESPTPKTIQNIASTLQWIDDINDGLVTLAYLFRVGLRIMGFAAPKIGGRLVPGLGYVLLAKDLFDIAKWIRGTGILRAQGKRGFWEILESIPWLTRKKIKPLKKLNELLPSFAEAVQIAQTTEVLTGYGLRIGPLFGHVYDSVFGTLRGAKFEGLNKAFQPKEMVAELRRQKAPLDKSPNLTPASTDAIRILNSAPHVLMYAEDLSFGDNIKVLNACNMAATYLEGTQDLRDWEVWAKDTLDEPAKAISISDDIRYEIEDDILIDPGSKGVFPYLGGIIELSPRMKSSLPGNSISDSFRKVIKSNRMDPRVSFFVSLIAEFSDHFLRAYEGNDFRIKTKMNVDAKSYFLLQEYGLAKKLGTPDDLHMSLAASITQELIRTQRNSLTYQEIDAMIDIYKRIK